MKKENSLLIIILVMISFSIGCSKPSPTTTVTNPPIDTSTTGTGTGGDTTPTKGSTVIRGMLSMVADVGTLPSNTLRGFQAEDWKVVYVELTTYMSTSNITIELLNANNEPTVVKTFDQEFDLSFSNIAHFKQTSDMDAPDTTGKLMVHLFDKSGKDIAKNINQVYLVLGDLTNRNDSGLFSIWWTDENTTATDINLAYVKEKVKSDHLSIIQIH